MSATNSRLPHGNRRRRFIQLEGFTLRGLVTYYVPFFIGHETPFVDVACVTAFDHAKCLQFFRIALRQSQP
jgi:hypothetical protein